MGREAQKKTIDGIDVTVTPFPAVEAVRIQALIVRLLGPAMGRVAGALDNLFGAAKTKALGELRIDGTALAGAIAELSDKLGEDQFMTVLRRMLRGVQCVVQRDGQALVVDFGEDKKFDTAFDLVFGGQTMTVYPVLAWVMQVNYPDFFQKVLGTGGLLGTILSSKPAVGSASESSTSLDS